MDSRHKHRLHSVDNLVQTRILGRELSAKQMDAVYEEALEAVLTALKGDAGLSDLDAPFLCAALHFWHDVLIERMRREHPAYLEAEKIVYILMKLRYRDEGVKVGGDE